MIFNVIILFTNATYKYIMFAKETNKITKAIK